MAIEWTGSGPGVLLRIDRDSGEPLRRQLENALCEAIRTGRLAAGERLPSSRALARELGLSRGLVTECYAQLQAEGYLVTRAGSATRVAQCARPNTTPLSAQPTTGQRAAPRIDFRPGVPDMSAFPREDWGRALRTACRDAPSHLLDRLDPYGTQELREVLAGYLRRVRSGATDATNLLVTSGFAQGLNLVLRSVADHGARTVAFEDPGDVDHRTIAATLGLRVVGVPVDDGGIDIEKLRRTDARAVVLTPAHQSPTGVVLAPDRRQALADWAAEHDATVIEDDYDAEFRYDREPVGVLQGLAPDRVALLGSVSKSLAPGLRLGWIACPPWLAEAVAEHKRIADRGSPVLEQLAFADLLRSGRYDRHLRQMRQRYAARRTALVDELARHAPAVRVSGLAAGFHAVAHLPHGVSERAVASEALHRSVGLYPMGDYRIDRASVPPQLVLGFGNLTTGAIAEGVALVADLFERPVRDV